MESIEVRTPSHTFGWSEQGLSTPFAVVRSFPVSIEFEVLANAPVIQRARAIPGSDAREGLLRLTREPQPARFRRPYRRGAIGEVVRTEDVLTLTGVQLHLEIVTRRSFVLGQCSNRTTEGGRLKQPRFVFLARPVLSYAWTLTSHSVKFNNRGEAVEQAPIVVVKERAAEDGSPWRMGPGTPVLRDDLFDCQTAELGTPLHRWFDHAIRRELLVLA